MSVIPGVIASTSAACASLLLAASVQAADATPPSCMTAYENAQLYRQSGKLIEAHDAALICSRPSCPDVGRKDCEAWAAEIEREIPSVVVVVQDQYYVDERGARVVVDGVQRPGGASGRAFELNPGEHVFRVERPGFEPIERSIVVVQGERDRILRFSLRPLTPPAPPPPPPQPTQVPESTPPAARTTYVPALLVGGAAVAAFGVSAWLGVTGRSDLSNLRDTCAPACLPDDVDSVKRKLYASDIVLGVGLIGAAVSTYLFLRPPSLGRTVTGRVSVALAPGGATLSVGSSL
jgi:hypothetical protein